MPPPPRGVTSAVADGVGLVGVVVGTLLVAAPRASGRRLHLETTSVCRRRALGVVDLTLGATILSARDSGWRWLPLAAHSAMHLPFAGEYVRAARPFGAAIMCALLAFDAAVAVAVRRR